MNNVTLRKLNKEDKMIIFGWISDPALRKMTGTKEKPTIDSHNQWFMEKFHNESGYYRIIEYAEKPVGFMGTNTVDLHNNSAEIFIYIGTKEYRRRGIAKEAVKLYIDLLHYEGNICKIYARVFSFNAASISLFEKCGFTLEGNQSDHKDTYTDLLWFGMTLP